MLDTAEDVDAFPELAQPPEWQGQGEELLKALYFCSVPHPTGDSKSTSVKQWRSPAGFLEAAQPRKWAVEEKEASANWKND